MTLIQRPAGQQLGRMLEQSRIVRADRQERSEIPRVEGVKLPLDDCFRII